MTDQLTFFCFPKSLQNDWRTTIRQFYRKDFTNKTFPQVITIKNNICKTALACI